MTTSPTSSTTGSNPATDVTASAQPYGIPQRATRSRAWIGVVLAVVVLVAAAGWKVADWSRIASETAKVDKFAVTLRSFAVVLKEKGELRAARSTEIMCAVEGRSTIISLVPEGTTVKKGDLLVELASDQIEDRIRQDELKEANAITAFEAAKTNLEIQRDQNASDIRKAKLQIELRKLELEKYAKGDWVQSQKDADIAIQQAEISLERQKEVFEASEQLFERDFITKTEFEEDKFKHIKARWDLEKAIKAKEVLETYTHVADLRQRESDHEEAVKESDRVLKNADAEEINKVRALEGKRKELELIQDQLAKLRVQKENCRIVAPTQGLVVYYSGGGRGHFMSSDSQIREGATVHERQIILTLPDTSEMQVVVRIHEAKTDKLKLGQRVAIQVEGMPGREFGGTVSKIAAVADSQNRWLNPDLKEYETEITLDETDAPLKPGVTAHAEILVERVDQKLAVPVQAVYSKAGQRYVFASKGGNTRPVKVELGAIGTEWAEIQAGLNGGEQVLLAFSDEQKRLIPDDRSFGSPNSRTPGSKSAATQKRRGGRRPSSPGSAVKSAAGHSRPAHSGSTGAQGHAGS